MLLEHLTIPNPPPLSRVVPCLSPPPPLAREAHRHIGQQVGRHPREVQFAVDERVHKVGGAGGGHGLDKIYAHIARAQLVPLEVLRQNLERLLDSTGANALQMHKESGTEMQGETRKYKNMQKKI